MNTNDIYQWDRRLISCPVLGAHGSCTMHLQQAQTCSNLGRWSWSGPDRSESEMTRLNWRFPDFSWYRITTGHWDVDSWISVGRYSHEDGKGEPNSFVLLWYCVMQVECSGMKWLMAADYAWPMLGMWICQRSCYHGTARQDPRIIRGVVGQEIWGSLVTESQVACDKDNKSTQNPHNICKVHDTSHDTKPCVRNPKSAQKHSMVTMPPTWVSTSQQKPQWNEQKASLLCPLCPLRPGTARSK